MSIRPIVYDNKAREIEVWKQKTKPVDGATVKNYL